MPSPDNLHVLHLRPPTLRALDAAPRPPLFIPNKLSSCFFYSSGISEFIAMVTVVVRWIMPPDGQRHHVLFFMAGLLLVSGGVSELDCISARRCSMSSVTCWSVGDVRGGVEAPNANGAVPQRMVAFVDLAYFIIVRPWKQRDAVHQCSSRFVNAMNKVISSLVWPQKCCCRVSYVACICMVVEGCCWVGECGVGMKVVGGLLVSEELIIDGSVMAAGVPGSLAM